jgi:ABC-type multidrug transport system ATPase subunit
MSEAILEALMKLFALIGDLHDDTVISGKEKNIVRTFLSRHLNNELIFRYMKIYEEHLDFYNSQNIAKGSVKDMKRISLNAMRILAICEKINEELEQKQKIYVLVQLIDYISLGEEITENEFEFLHTVATSFYIPETDYEDIKNFIMNDIKGIHEKERLLIADNKKRSAIDSAKHLFNSKLEGTLMFLYIPLNNIYLLRYTGHEDLYLNGQNIFAGQTYIFDHGSSIRGSGIDAIYYTEVISLITEAAFEHKVNLLASDIFFKFKNSDNGIHNLNFHEESGKLVGILGGSGVGKSTTLSILNGTLKPQKGEVLINGYNLYDEKEREFLKGVIGYVPQDDLLIEELTVYQNLYFNARMCLDNFSEEELIKLVDQTLTDLDLYEVKDLVVGNPLKKIISGGQRKRVNIALELIREPTILFVDEPTSGLSSVDSETVMSLLKEQTYKGKLVIVNIHQPGSDIYKMFDKIMIIDKGGYQVYYGNPTEAIVYFKKVTNHANPDEDQCAKCGNINTDQILQILEAKVVDERGRATRIRKITPEEWAKSYQENYKKENITDSHKKERLPQNNYSIPGLLKQSKLFFIRDLLSKIADKQYIIINLLGPPFLAFLLAYFTRSSGGGTYRFSENENIPAYLFMCVITSLFFGLMISSEEIVKDRKILKRESFLNLSWFSYLNSKIMIMFILSAIQTLSFIIIGNLILEIRDMTLTYWLVLFTTSCFANILGLNISSAFNSVITIYILIPFIIIPQLLFSGVLVKFDKLHLSRFATREYTPVIGDLMVARWSFEALAVEQFKNNKYERIFFRYDTAIIRPDYYANFLIVKLEKDLTICSMYKDSTDYKDLVDGKFERLHYYIDQLSGKAGLSPGSWENNLNSKDFTPAIKKETQIYLDSMKRIFYSFRNRITSRKEIVRDSLQKATGKKAVVDMRYKYENEELIKLVLDQLNFGDKALDQGDKIVPKYNPGYMAATSKYGRAHFYAPAKQLGNLVIDTYWFNMLVIWVLSILLYIALYFKIFRRILDSIENLNLRKPEV